MRTYKRYSTINIIINLMYLMGFFLIAVGIWDFIKIMNSTTEFEMVKLLLWAVGYKLFSGISIIFTAGIGQVIIDIALAVVPSNDMKTQNPSFQSSYEKSIGATNLDTPPNF